ncbi:hypothetical protein HPB47_014096 [Ixodes persulcatus]|uniref:Uncharacterized protein n=1 Tax=Ixodes persulcatus TaxID=34615 RepID=A0AC60R1J3_IXOPE|nr:hypothetical protein HPB47_014096 [Ixodes persulcatus]
MQLHGLTGSVFDNISAALNITYDVVLPEDSMWGSILEDGSYTGMLKAVHEKNSETEMYSKLQQMITRNRGERDLSELYNPDDINLVMQEKAVMLMDKFSPKLHLSHMCPSLEGKFYIGKGSLYLWSSVWVTHKDFPKDVLVEINKRIRAGHPAPPVRIGLRKPGQLPNQSNSKGQLLVVTNEPMDTSGLRPYEYAHLLGSK